MKIFKLNTKNISLIPLIILLLLAIIFIIYFILVNNYYSQEGFIFKKIRRRFKKLGKSVKNLVKPKSNPNSTNNIKTLENNIKILNEKLKNAEFIAKGKIATLEQQYEAKLNEQQAVISNLENTTASQASVIDEKNTEINKLTVDKANLASNYYTEKVAKDSALAQASKIESDKDKLQGQLEKTTHELNKSNTETAKLTQELKQEQDDRANTEKLIEKGIAKMSVKLLNDSTLSNLSESQKQALAMKADDISSSISVSSNNQNNSTSINNSSSMNSATAMNSTSAMNSTAAINSATAMNSTAAMNSNLATNTPLNTQLNIESTEITMNDNVSSFRDITLNDENLLNNYPFTHSHLICNCN